MSDLIERTSPLDCGFDGQPCEPTCALFAPCPRAPIGKAMSDLIERLRKYQCDEGRPAIRIDGRDLLREAADA